VPPIAFPPFPPPLFPSTPPRLQRGGYDAWRTIASVAMASLMSMSSQWARGKLLRERPKHSLTHCLTSATDCSVRRRPRQTSASVRTLTAFIPSSVSDSELWTLLNVVRWLPNSVADFATVSRIGLSLSYFVIGCMSTDPPGRLWCCLFSASVCTGLT